MMDYRRICRKQRKVEQGCDVYISRGCNGGGWNLLRSKWDVPTELSKLPAKEMQQRYRQHVLAELSDAIPELAYQQLGCWCKKEDECHAKVLRELVTEYLATHHHESIPTTFMEPLEQRIVLSKSSLYKVTKMKRERKATKKKQALGPPPSASVASPSGMATDCCSIISEQSFRAQYADVLTEDGKVPVCAIMTNVVVIQKRGDRSPFPETNDLQRLPDPIEYETENKIRVVVQPMWPPKPLPFVVAEHTHIITALKPDKDFVGMLNAGGVHTKKMLLGMDMVVTDWPPFVARVVKIIRNKTNGRFHVLLSSADLDKANKANSVKVHLASQCVVLIENRFVRKDDLVYVEHYAITKLGPRKHIIIATEVKKATAC